MDVFKTLILDTPTVEGATGTVTSVDLTAGTGISVSGGPITSAGSINVTNTAPDQTVALTGGTGISTSGTYPNFTITNDAPDQTVSIASGTGISATGTYPNFTVTNSAPDQTVSIASGTGISVTGTYPNFTVTNSSPSSGGDVVGPASSTDNGIVRFDGTTGKLVQDSSSVVIDDSGNVGIGTTSPSAKTHIAAGDSATANGQFIVSGGRSLGAGVAGGAGGILLTNSYWTGGYGAGAVYGIDSGGSGGGLAFATTADGGGTTGSPAERVRIDQAGNVGIGTTTPSSTLEAVGDITASGTGNKTLKVATTSNAYSYLTMNAWALDRAQLRAETYSGGGSGSGGGILSMWTGNTSGTMTQRMAIDGAGNVGIGTTTPGFKLQVNGDIKINSATTGAIRWSNDDSSTWALIQYDDSNGHLSIGTPAGRAYNVNLIANGSNVAVVSSTGLAVTGAITATGNITAYYSDDRLKTKLGNIENALDKVSKLNGFYYEANETAQALGYKPVREVGLSAQQVEAVLPEVVAPAPIDNEYKTLHYERVIPLLVEAIKELKAEIELLKK